MNEILCGMEIKLVWKGLHLKRQCGVACADVAALTQHVAEAHAKA